MEVTNDFYVKPGFQFHQKSLSEFTGKGEAILSWQFIQEHFPWHVIFIVGGGLAISDAANVSGLAVWLGDQFNGLENLSRYVVLLLIVLIISFLTELMSNAAAVSLLTPILIALVRTSTGFRRRNFSKNLFFDSRDD